MSKKIEDYLHLYLNAGIGFYVFTDESITDGFLDKYKTNHPNGVYAPILTRKNYENVLRDRYKPILRPLSDMTEEESEFQSNAAWEGKSTILMNAEITAYLLSKHFDLFNLIPEGLAIDSTTLK